jgi:hypothetical protein
MVFSVNTTVTMRSIERITFIHASISLIAKEWVMLSILISILTSTLSKRRNHHHSLQVLLSYAGLEINVKGTEMRVI